MASLMKEFKGNIIKKSKAGYEYQTANGEWEDYYTSKLSIKEATQLARLFS